MKWIIWIIGLGLVITLRAETPTSSSLLTGSSQSLYAASANAAAEDAAYRANQVAMEAQKAARQAEAEAQERKQYTDLKNELSEIITQPSRHFRRIGESTNFDGDLHLISGKVLQVLPAEGILVIQDEFNAALERFTYTGPTVFVVNYPLRVVDEEKVILKAELVDSYSYTDVRRANRTVEKYDYGMPVNPTPEMLANSTAQLKSQIAAIDDKWALQRKQIADAKAKAAATTKAAFDRALKSNQDAAARGDIYGLLRMGERYRDGEGVEKDLTKAREYLKKAMDAGAPSAADELSKIKP